MAEKKWCPEENPINKSIDLRSLSQIKIDIILNHQNVHIDLQVNLVRVPQHCSNDIISDRTYILVRNGGVHVNLLVRNGIH